MSVDRWLASAVADVRARGLEGAVPVLQAFARAMVTLRAADWNASASGAERPSSGDAPRSNDRQRRVPAPVDVGRRTGRAGDRASRAREPHELDIVTAAERLRDRTLTSLALTESCLAQIDRLDPALHAFITVTRDQALAAARIADDEMERGEWRGPLHGIPISLKDLITVSGTATTAGSNVPDRTPATADAPVTSALRRAGAVLVGKTNLHEFAFGTTSDESAFGPVRHPRDPQRSAGGSSGGSAVAVATGMSLASIGTDTGGSIRIPSAACGLVGLKPGLGEVSCEGVVPLSRTMDHVGPLTRSVADAAVVHGALTGSAADQRNARDPRTLRIGVLREYFEDLLETGVREAVTGFQRRLSSGGATLVDVRLPHAGDIAAIYLAIVFAESAAFHGKSLETRGEQYQPDVRLRLEAARYVLGEDYLRAMEGRDVIRAEVDRALEGCDVLLAPTLPIAPPLLHAASVTVENAAHPVRALMLRLTQPFNITGHPAVTLPCGMSLDELPCGVQLVGRHGQTAALLEVALACEPYGMRGSAGD